MHCKHCGFVNGEDDHRCLRCGRRLSGMVIAAPPGYSGANALAPVVLMNDDTEEFLPVKNVPLNNVALNNVALNNVEQAPSRQPGLFTPPPDMPPNVIPFDRLQRQVASRAPRPVAQAPVSSSARVAGRKTASAAGFTKEAQGSLDFIPASSSKGRKLKTDVDAQVFCDQPVATPTHRFVASAIDGALILIGFGLLSLTFVGLGGSFGSGKVFWMGLAGTFVLVSMLYGLIWAIAGRETAGMRFTDLQLITFDGFQLDARSRALRFASAWLSFCSGGLGLLWAVADEENLTWHDHISKTFPTIREIPGTFVKQRG
jgi:uncharacterized RDD family membrane protein YckC